MYRGNIRKPRGGGSHLGHHPNMRAGPRGFPHGHHPNVGAGPGGFPHGPPPNVGAGPGGSLLGLPPNPHAMSLALSRANNEVHTLKRQISNLNALYRDSFVEKENMSRQIEKLSDLQITILTEENESLSLKLTESAEELIIANETWQRKYEDLEKKTSKDMEYQQQSMDSEVAELLSNNAALEEEVHTQKANNNQLEAESKLLKDERDALAETIRENKDFTLKLIQKTKQLIIANETLQQKYEDLEKNTSKDMEHQQQSMDSKVAELLSNNTALEEEVHTQKANNNQLEAESKLLKDERDALADLGRSQEKTYNDMELRLITQIQQMEDDITLLENICLDMKKKKRGLFGKKMRDRQTEMDKMRRKMQDKETKKSDTEKKTCKETIQDASTNQSGVSLKRHIQENTLKCEESFPITLIQQLMENIEEGDTILMAKIQQMEDDITLLENICLDMEKEKRGMFGRKMQDRQTELDKMRRKMQDKEKKKSERPKKTC